MRCALAVFLLAVSAQAQTIVSRKLPVAVSATPQRITAPIPFRAVGAAEPLRLRASADGAAWTEWTDLVPDDPAGMVFFGELNRFLEVTGTGETELLFIDPDETPRWMKERPRFAVSPPAVVTREQWGCTPQNCVVQRAPQYTTPTHLIDPNGVLYEGRAGGDGVLGAHFSGVNSGTVGLSMIGSYATLAPPGTAVETLKAALAWQADRWKIDPGGQSIHAASGLLLNTVSGHRDAGFSPKAAGTTECPGNGLYTQLPSLRGAARALISAAAWPAPKATCLAGAPCVMAVISSAGADDRPVVPGSLVSVYGANLDGAEVSINGQPAATLYVGPSQINLRLPPSVNTGTAQVVATANGLAGAPFNFWVTEAVPAIFTYGGNRAAAQNWEEASALNGPDSPVRAGGILVVYLTGVSGANPPWSATIGGRPAGKLYLGPTPGFAGLFQANLIVPVDAAPGDEPLTIGVSGATSQPATVTLRR